MEIFLMAAELGNKNQFGGKNFFKYAMMKLVEAITNLQSNDIADVFARKGFSMRPKMLFPLTFDMAWVKTAIKTDAHKKQTVSI